jgi:hypothetical protein
MPTPRNLGNEIQSIGSLAPYLATNFVEMQNRLNPQLTAGNVGAYRTALMGTPTFKADAYLASRPDLVANFNGDPGYKEHYGSLEDYARADFDAWGNNDPRFQTYNNTGAIGLAREGFNAANPELAGFTASLPGMLNMLRGGAPAPLQAAGYTPATSRFSGATASTARTSRAAGGPLLGRMERDAGANLGQVSPLQLMRQKQAMELVGAGGGLTRGEEMGVQDSARAAYSDRGMMRSNRGIGAEILATDAARRGRLTENLAIAGGIDADGQSQLAQNRGYAMGVQNQRQGLNTFNTGQVNLGSQFNAGLLTDTSRFNASTRTSNNQFNAAQRNQGGAFNATATNNIGVFNSGMARDMMNDDWGRAMQYGGFLNSQRIDPMALAGGLMGQTPDYTGPLLGYGGDLYNTNFNAAAAAEIAKKNNKAGMWSAALGTVGTIGGAMLGGPMGAALGAKLGSAAGSKIGGG